MNSAAAQTCNSREADDVLCNRQQQLEQERRDRELALRLVAEDQSMVEDIQPVRFLVSSIITTVKT